MVISKFNIAIITTSRAEFGLLKGVIFHLSKISNLTLFVGGSHLENKSTYKEINEFTSSIDLKKIDLFYKKDNLKNLNASKQMFSLGRTGELLVSYFDDLNIDLIIMLGDRWELLSASISALFTRIPIAHISGGEITRGAIDENIRHSITKMAHLHFVACQNYAENVSSMGEEDWRISITGETGLDWIHSKKIKSFKDTMKFFNLPIQKKLILFTYHPVSYGNRKILNQEMNEISKALGDLKEFTILMTGPGQEIDSEYVREKLILLKNEFSHIHYEEHLGRENYLSLMSKAKVVLGNSSSGIVEAPSLGINSINIGNRQEGREKAQTTIDVVCSSEIIIQRVRESLDLDIKKNSKQKFFNPYDPYLDGRNSLRVALGCINALTKLSKEKLLNKKFSKAIKPNEWNKIININMNSNE